MAQAYPLKKFIPWVVSLLATVLVLDSGTSEGAGLFLASQVWALFATLSLGLGALRPHSPAELCRVGLVMIAVSVSGLWLFAEPEPCLALVPPLAALGQLGICGLAKALLIKVGLAPRFGSSSG